VLIAEKAGACERAVLTDFELAKLLDGSPSVSSEWPEDPFRAPELEAGESVSAADYPRADLYSLGCLAAAAITGQTPAAGQAASVLRQAALPPRLKRLLADCVRPVPSQRPPGIAPLIKELDRLVRK
jgi:serine/threonine protein kinase